jgi:hypothetical protein
LAKYLLVASTQCLGECPYSRPSNLHDPCLSVTQTLDCPPPHQQARKALAGGAIATFIGIMLRVFGPSSTSGVPLNPHQMAYAFLGIGIFLLFVGFLARMLSK